MSSINSFAHDALCRRGGAGMPSGHRRGTVTTTLYLGDHGETTVPVEVDYIAEVLDNFGTEIIERSDIEILAVRVVGTLDAEDAIIDECWKHARKGGN